jgi:siderophore synthetase component
MNARLKPIAADPTQHNARQRGLQRTLQALFREQLLEPGHLIHDHHASWLPLWGQRAMLRFEGLRLGRIGNLQLDGAITLMQAGRPPQVLDTPEALLAGVAPSLPGPPAAEDLQRLSAELENSTANDALCAQYRAGWADRLSASLGARHPQFLAALRAAGQANIPLLLEQWGTLGHPSHPTYKAKLGLDPNEVIALSPEFEAQLELPLAALRASKAHTSLADGGEDYRSWFGRTYPQAWQAWLAALQARGLPHQDWLPLPTHPYQSERQLPQLFAQEIAAGDLLLLDAAMPATPTMSFRTVTPYGSAQMPHVKLPVSLVMTSAQRTVSPKSVVMGPRVSRLLSVIVANEGGFDGTLAIVPELCGIHLLDADDDRARHLSALYRANPAACVAPGMLPVPVGALFAESPFSGRALVTEAVALSGSDDAAGAQAFFRHYAATVLRAVLSPYLLYGVAFEAHQQNSFIVLDRQFRPVQLLVRDFGDIRIHRPTLERSGHALQTHRSGHVLFDDVEFVRAKVLHAVLLCQLSELALLLARSYGCDEDVFWRILADATGQVLDVLRARVDPARWQQEGAALLEDDWPVKSLLRMRFKDSPDDTLGRMPNPLREAQR